MAIYRLDYNADGRKAPAQNVWDAAGGSLLVDQPINGAGPWFSGLRPLWHRQQLTDLRRAGIDVALIQRAGDDPLLGRELDALVEALKEMKAQRPGLSPDRRGRRPAGTPSLRRVYAHIPAEFRATCRPPGEQARPGRSTPGIGAATAGPALAGRHAAYGYFRRRRRRRLAGPRGPRRVRSARRAADLCRLLAARRPTPKPQFVVIDSWNDFSHGTEVCASPPVRRAVRRRHAPVRDIAFNGSHEWHAKYLAEYAPRTIQPKTLYQIPIRIENAGTLPWRARRRLRAGAALVQGRAACSTTARRASPSARTFCRARRSR